MRFASIVMGVVMVAQTVQLYSMLQNAYEDAFKRPITRYRMFHNHLPVIPEKREEKGTRTIKYKEYKCMGIMGCCLMGMKLIVESCFPKS